MLQETIARVLELPEDVGGRAFEVCSDSLLPRRRQGRKCLAEVAVDDILREGESAEGGNGLRVR